MIEKIGKSERIGRALHKMNLGLISAFPELTMELSATELLTETLLSYKFHLVLTEVLPDTV